MENNEKEVVVEEVVKSEENKKMKLQRKNPFVKMKKKPLILTIAIAGAVLIGGIGSLTFINNDKFDITLNGYEKAIVAPAKALHDARELDLKFVSLSTDESAAYNLTTGTEEDMYIHPDNATLIDINPEGKAPFTNELKGFKNALVDNFGKTEEKTLDSIFIGLLKDQPVYIQTMQGQRNLVSLTNTVLYREIKESELKNFKNPDKYETAYLQIGNKSQKFTQFIGEKDVIIDEQIELYSIAVVGKDGKYYEYLARPRNFILVGKYTNETVLLSAGPIKEGELRIFNSTAEGLSKNVDVQLTSTDVSNDFIYVVTKDNRLIKISRYNSMFINGKIGDSYAYENSGYESLLLGLEEEIYPTRIKGFRVEYNDAYNFGALNAFWAKKDNNQALLVSSENAIPVDNIEATTPEELKVLGFTLFDEYTTCTITSKGLEESFQAVGYHIRTFGQLGGVKLELICVVREIQGSYYVYAIPKSECIIQSKNLDIERESYVKTK